MQTLPKRALTFFADLVFPPKCALCARVDSELCAACIARFEPLNLRAACPICAEPATGGRRCERCQAQPPAFRRVTSAFLYKEVMKKAVYAYKYEGYAYLTKHLVHAMRPHLHWPTPDPDAWLCAVPLSEERMAQRGFNQAHHLMDALAAHMGRRTLPPHALRRIRHTPALIGLTPAERRRHLMGSFAAAAEAVVGRSIILIDDVCTTGTTLHACAVALRSAGAQHIFGLTLARTPKKHDRTPR
jgi:ComF family protein